MRTLTTSASHRLICMFDFFFHTSILGDSRFDHYHIGGIHGACRGRFRDVENQQYVELCSNHIRPLKFTICLPPFVNNEKVLISLRRLRAVQQYFLPMTLNYVLATYISLSIVN